MGILDKKKELEEKSKGIILEAIEVKSKKGSHYNVKKYFIWGSWHTVQEVANKLNLSRQYCHKKLAGGYEHYLENYKRESRQIQEADKQRREKYKENPSNKKSKEDEEEFSFLEAIEN